MGTLRVIDKGTRYDVSTPLRRLVRQIESGEIKPRDVVIVTAQYTAKNASPAITLHHFGSGSVPDLHWMLATAQNRIQPA
jgi:hypothetical protein